VREPVNNLCVKMSAATRQKWLRELNDRDDFPFKYLTGSGNKVYCKVCEASFAGAQKSQFQSHKASEKHKKNTELKSKWSSSQTQLEDLLVQQPKKSRSDLLGRELCEAFLAANISWSKLESPKLRSFLEVNIGITIPNERTLRMKYLDECYKDVIEKIEVELRGQPLWISVNESTDACGRAVANVLAGKLDKDGYQAPLLINCSFLEKTDSSTIARLVNDSLRKLWPNFDTALFKLLLTDAASYMLKSGKDLKVFYPSLESLTCCAHGLHRVCETARGLFKEVNKLIAAVKKVFLKCPARIALWKDSYPNLPLPPSPITTR